MLSRIINFSIQHKLIVGLFTLALVVFGVFSLTRLSIGAVPDITNNQVQVITTSQNLSTADIEQFITYPIELEMANLPGVIEIRSTSQFGLSVVTIVFEEKMGTYLPRQLIAEKIQTAKENIPEGFGTPEIAPITTGLGEVYHYTLEVKPEFEDRYSLSDLRTIQDWIIKRQLSGIPGVVEVNSWGGHLKQYEVAIDPKKLNAANITVQEVLSALEKNNSLSGGGYIEKENQVYFIRGDGLITSLEDIRNVVVKTQDGFPIYVKDIAKVHFGIAPRYGAITANGEGEKVLGQILMLKDADDNAVIKAIEERVAQVSENLPPGVYINPFMERSILIGETTATVAENIILGILIVIFVVVLLLGNLRSGFVVASVIPLSLLFTLSMMYLFKIDANLMSMGAIDFGIIIDGAVIIVEFVAFQIARNRTELLTLPQEERQKRIDGLTFTNASKMMNAAIFGQLIILIVFIPILSLSGVEGKMFKPMAMTFSFALIGAMILCFTYVPMASALFIKPTEKQKKSFSDKIMERLNKWYDPVIRGALKAKKTVLGIASVLLLIAILIFTSMGGEFVPTLDEGDFVLQPVLKTGTSLTSTIETTTEIERILMENFPEVEQVVSRIGAAEVPTDPMSMEASDVMVSLKPKKEWKTVKTKNELADKMAEALSVIPGMDVEFTQPIEMRFNELITGVRADIAIKIFGTDMEYLGSKANEIKRLIEDVEGADDIIVEKVVGLPEMRVNFNRAKIARYGLNVEELNNLISMGFTGIAVGVVFEGERKYDLVLRLDEKDRNDIKDLQNLYVDLPSGDKVPLRELAEITFERGAAQISREDTQRRIVVGVNVRNRDLQSVYDDIKERIDAGLSLQSGYYITYGGQFENLQAAKDRLLVAVPVALLLIFILLYFAFHSIQKALIIFSAIPLAAVGGILLLWVRDMPFSISAGVGFIALFGIAVLNGIVLIEHFEELKREGISDLNERIIRGTKDRLRAVLLTASAAALGYLPMAVSTKVGAEVQRPLATVVIGGLFTATILTLVVLPVLYSIFEKRKFKMKKLTTVAPVLVALILSAGKLSAQQPQSLEELKQLAKENNSGIKASRLQVDEASALVNSAAFFDKTHIYYEYDENNVAPNNLPLDMIGVEQDLVFPGVFVAERQMYKNRSEIQQNQLDVRMMEMDRDVSLAFYEFQYAKQREEIYRKLDSLYSDFSKASERRFELGETNYLEKIMARAKQKELETELLQAKEEVKIVLEKLQSLVQTETFVNPVILPNEKLHVEMMSVEAHPMLKLFQNTEEFYKSQQKYERRQRLPDLSFSYAIGSNKDLNENLYAYQLGLKIPLLFVGKSSKIKASKIVREIAREQIEELQIQLGSRQKQLLNQLRKYEESLNYYENEGKSLSEEIMKTADISFKNGEIDFFQYIQSLENVYNIDLSFLENLHRYNQTIISINYLTLRYENE